jgi:LuxR family quorum-sensing transcriptional regulator LasR
MKSVEQFAELMAYTCETSWRNKIFQFGRELGYEHTLLAILPCRNTKTEAGNAFLHSNFSQKWRTKYDDEQMSYVDPTVTHCMTKSIPLIWSPQVFATRSQKELYEESSSHGLSSGISLPVRGSNGEFGMFMFASAVKLDRRFEAESIRNIPALICLRDFVCETSQRFMKQPALTTPLVSLTKRELECLKLCADGKSSWDIGKILHCTEAGVNFHFKNIRRKFGTASRHQALVKAIQMGLVNPA